jgi:hypothetical protein
VGGPAVRDETISLVEGDPDEEDFLSGMREVGDDRPSYSSARRCST